MTNFDELHRSSGEGAASSSLLTKPLLVFDGDCGFCTTSAKWIQSKWSAQSASAVAWQRLGENRLAELGLDLNDVRTKAWWVDAQSVRGGERAVAASLIHAGGLWALAGRVIDFRFFRPLAKAGYRLVARYRYRLPGATDACRL
jgi:predicted DCC family thiol-disulfide oxidoreductase YuxK